MIYDDANDEQRVLKLVVGLGSVEGFEFWWFGVLRVKYLRLKFDVLV